MSFERRSNAGAYQRTDRPSFDQLSQHGPLTAGSAGYNPTSFMAPHREEPIRPGRDEEEFMNAQPQDQLDEGFDIYADFNNAGPKYSSAYTQPSFTSSKPSENKGYRQIRNDSSAKSEVLEPATEMVTVPKFGPEWKASELREMTKSGRKAARDEARRTTWRQWTRDQHGFCGGRVTRKAVVIFVFCVCVVVGIVLAITIPRVPSFSFKSTSPFIGVNNTDPEAYKTAFSRIPANFSFPALLDLNVDTHSNVIPIHFNSIKAQVYEANTFALVATGEIGATTMPSKDIIPLLFPLTFEYEAVNSSDLTWLHFYQACQNHVAAPGGVRPGVDVRLIINMSIRGLIKSVATSTQISGVGCPIELPQDSV